MTSRWDTKEPFGQNGVIRAKLAEDGWVEKMDILYGQPGQRVGAQHGHLVMGPDGDTRYLRTVSGEVKVDKK